jgi:signal transduction histidine kinase
VYSRQYIEVQTPWYSHRWALALYSIGLLFGFWSLASLYTYSVRQRNNMLQQKVDEQTAAIRRVNTSLEENFHRLELSEQNLRRNMRVRDRLISIITHDILTPLRFIGLIARMGAEAPAQEEDEEGLTKKALSDVQHAVGKLFLSTQNMLNWVNVQQEAFKPKHSNCSPFVITEQLMEDFSEIARFQGNTMFNAVGEDDVIYTDPQILTIILHNLLSNALKFTKKGVIKVGSGNGHEGYYLEVEDTGRGMTQAQLHALRQGAIDQQHTASNDDASAGNGIGLSLVYALLQALGGRWEIYSTEGAGVRVRIYLNS